MSVLLWKTRDIYRAMERILKVIDRTLLSVEPSKRNNFAVAFDLDETCIMNTIIHDEDVEIRANEAVLWAARQLFDRGIALFGITARVYSEDAKKYAADQLFKLGFPPFVDLFLFPVERETDGTVSLFKRDMRQKISESLNFSLLLNVGDQASDIMVGTSTNNDFHKDMIYCFMISEDPALFSVKLQHSYEII